MSLLQSYCTNFEWVWLLEAVCYQSGIILEWKEPNFFQKFVDLAPLQLY